MERGKKWQRQEGGEGERKRRKDDHAGVGSEEGQPMGTAEHVY